MTSMTGVAFVTGAASGIGKATAIAYAAAGCHGLTICDINDVSSIASACQAAATHASFRILTATVDVTSESQVTAIVQKTQETFGRLDYAANLAGIIENSAWPPTETVDMDMALFDHVYNVNARGVAICVKAEVAAMRAQEPAVLLEGRPGVRGSIVNMASMAGVVPFPGFTAYGASKHAVIGITKNAAVSHTKDGIRINSVLPHFVDTPLLTEKMPPDALAAYATTNYMKRLGNPEEVADVVVFMSSARCSFVNGAQWSVTGGSNSG